MKRSVFAIAGAAFMVFASSVVPISAQQARADEEPPTTIGVYRWDAWHGGTGGIYTSMMNTMEPTAYDTLLPFFAVRNPDGSVDIDDTDAQWKMDDEIEYAAEGGVDYWIFMRYPETDPYHSPMNESFAAYMSSPLKSELGFAFMLSQELQEGLSAGWDSARADIVDEMDDPQWQTVLDDRPILYVYQDAVGPNLATRMAQLRADAITSGLDDPYIVAVGFNGPQYGLDASTPWVSITGSSTGSPWSNFSSTVAAANDSVRNDTGKSVLAAHVNWDSRPYAQTPPPWWGSPPNEWNIRPTSAEYRDLVQAAVNLTRADPVENEANTIFVHSWNEFAEGGIMVPTKAAGGGVNTTVLDGLAQVNKLGTLTAPNLAAGRATYSASSQWNGTQGAAKAFDGNVSTNWQAGSSATFAGQWLEVDFGTSVTISSAALSEYGDRTSSYRIQYWDGSAWSTAYTGTAIGSAASPSFPAVTTTKARILFDSGTLTPIIYEFGVYGPSQNLADGRATYSSSSQWDSTQTSAKAFDSDINTNWQAASGSTYSAQWLQVDFESTLTFSQAVISEYGNRTTGFKVQYFDGLVWKDAYTGTAIGNTQVPATFSFAPVTGTKARLLFTSGNDGRPIIYELELRG